MSTVTVIMHSGGSPARQDWQEHAIHAEAQMLRARWPARNMHDCLEHVDVTD